MIKSLLTLIFIFTISLIQAQKPNILLIMSDDLNTQIGPYLELDEHTPNLNRLAEEGVKFNKAYCQFPLCGPSRASIMSGLYPETNGVITNNDKPGSYKKETPSLSDHPSMAGFFREQGYFTARVSKIYHMGVPGGIEQGAVGGDEPDSWDYAYNVMAPETLSEGKLELLSPKNLHYGGNFSKMEISNELDYTQADHMAATQAIAILESRAAKIAKGATNKVKLKPDEPFFLAVGFVRPHVPLIAPERCFDPYEESLLKLPEVKNLDKVPEEALRRQNEKVFGMSETQQRRTIAAYMASVQFMDEQVGRLLAALDRLKLRENTIVIFVSDHGYNLGEHDCWSKVSLWEGSIRVPMILSVPGEDFKKNHGEECEAITELIDLYPTLTDLSGFKQEGPKILQGESLAPFLKDAKVKPNDDLAYTISYGGKAASIRTDQWRYTRWGDGANGKNEELYDHKADPEELFNLVEDASKKKVLALMRKKFEDTKNEIIQSNLR
ncbi:sulfatase [Flexithrix dorotheae]|uniref:sulfatase n=1 Tax=Flexithrix dorotheae TaxID=70993 RepID=UPI00037E4734|nr:sulfatase [Flexithrix dorotheae]